MVDGDQLELEKSFMTGQVRKAEIRPDEFRSDASASYMYRGRARACASTMVVDD